VAAEHFEVGVKVKRESGDGSPPVGSRGKAPIVGMGPQKLVHFYNEN